MARRSSRFHAEQSRQLFSEAQDTSVLSRRFWTKCFQYRPLVLLGLFWLTLICISALAYSRLMFSGVPVNSSAGTTPPIRRSEPPVVIRPAPRSAGTPDQPIFSPSEPVVGKEAAPAAEAGAAEAAEGGAFPWQTVGEIFSLVGLCALGSFVIAQQAKRPPRPKRKKKMKRKAVAKPARKPKPPAKKSPGPKKLAPFAPERDSVVVPSVMLAAKMSPPRVDGAAARSPHATENPKAEGAASGGNRDPIRQPTLPVQSAANSGDGGFPQPEIHSPNIVPDHEDHPLDWSEESIAHSLDLRQRRSLSSFM